MTYFSISRMQQLTMPLCVTPLCSLRTSRNF